MVATGSANTYPYGQCTYWANDRFHAVTGHYVPWMGDAHSWASLALAYGWSVSSAPVSGPSIICLQPLTQLAGPLGHVAYVEAVQNATTVVTSNMNWGVTEQEQSQVRNITFHTGPGVTFISIGAPPFTGPSQTSMTDYTDYTSSSSNGVPGLDFSFLTNATKQLSQLGAWLNNPTRLFKLLAGVLFIGLAIYLLVEPEAQKVASKAAELAVLA